MPAATLRLALASVRHPASRADAVRIAAASIAEAGAAAADVVCFPESLVPGMRGQEFATEAHDQQAQRSALAEIAARCREHRVAAIVPMDWEGAAGLLNVAVVVDAGGAVLGMQAKTQIPPEEEPYYVPGTGRRLFTVRGVPVGIAICHEGWRYPETVRWAAVRGARVVFQPFFSGSDRAGAVPAQWGAPGGAIYEKAMVARAAENTIWFASVNYALRFPDAATSLVAPDGTCAAHVPYGAEALLVHDVDVSRATGLLASRLRPERYVDADDALAELGAWPTS